LQILLVLLVVLFAYLLIWLNTPYKATEDAIKLLSSTQTYSYSDTGNLEFIPNQPKEAGVIFYPGGRVEAKAYSYICAGIAQQGYPCIIAVMPFNLAVFKLDAAKQIIEKYPQVESWSIGGHSLGGSMAARYIKDNSTKIDSIFFMGSYTDVDLSKTTLKALILIGTEDAILNSQSYKDNYKNMPDARSINVIQGGNHSQFGDYGLQDGDLEAKISKQDQHQIIVDEILKLITAKL